jgi:hypothetical protein
MTLRILIVLLALGAAGCGDKPVEVNQAPDGDITIRLEMPDTLVSYSTIDGQTLQVTAIRSAWRIRDEKHWTTETGLTMCLYLVPYTTTADTICYKREDCK